MRRTRPVDGWLRAAVLAACAAACGACGACGKKAASAGAPPADGEAPRIIDAASHAPAQKAADPGDDDLWARARDGGPDDLARLADREGASGLVARGEADVALGRTAAQAMAYAPEPGAFGGLPFLARVARGPTEPEAEAALDSAVDLAARPRRAIDPEDAAEMKEGCDLLLALAKDEKAPRSRRVKAVRALRMLVDRGCADSSAIPTDLDAR